MLHFAECGCIQLSTFVLYRNISDGTLPTIIQNFVLWNSYKTLMQYYFYATYTFMATVRNFKCICNNCSVIW